MTASAPRSRARALPRSKAAQLSGGVTAQARESALPNRAATAGEKAEEFAERDTREQIRRGDSLAGRGGGETQEILATLVRTAFQRAIDLPDLFTTLLQAPHPIVPTVFERIWISLGAPPWRRGIRGLCSHRPAELACTYLSRELL